MKDEPLKLTLAQRDAVAKACGDDLPPHKVCGDCQHILQCQSLSGCKWINRKCDWNPSRFQLRVEH